MQADAMLTYADFEIRAWKSGSNQIQVMVHSSPAGDMRQPVAVQVTKRDLERLTGLQLVLIGMPAALELGTELTQYLLLPPAAELLVSSLEGLSATQGLRLRLCLDPALADIPWEFVRDPRAAGRSEMSGFLALEPRVSIVRDAPRAVNRAPAESGKQRLAFFGMAGANPELRLDEEFQRLAAALEPTKAYLEVERIAPGGDDLENALKQPAAVFHYSGGVWPVEKNGPGYLGRSFTGDALISCEEVGRLLRKAGTRLALLSASYSARWAFMEPLVRVGVPAAIGIMGLN
jgi:hypothetical protein